MAAAETIILQINDSTTARATALRIEPADDLGVCSSTKPACASVVNYGREFFRTHHVSRGSFQAAQEQFGVQGLVELTILMGYYGLLAFNCNAFDTDLVPERAELILPV